MAECNRGYPGNEKNMRTKPIQTTSRRQPLSAVRALVLWFEFVHPSPGLDDNSIWKGDLEMGVGGKCFRGGLPSQQTNVLPERRLDKQEEPWERRWDCYKCLQGATARHAALSDFEVVGRLRRFSGDWVCSVLGTYFNAGKSELLAREGHGREAGAGCINFPRAPKGTRRITKRGNESQKGVG
ncbi:hypothetical protein DM02DRAFT_623891 [Periconia macrospinosa]|uniref:Uncharacterized protein n=1 Tax=Periconia macrospinosa TaxID=97972 RepID=A0A2V1E5H9_9PLEO|nr:hypothetical protein DM02DRAFT_623891 [Periconia macrospinosa]